ncbi:MAG TPA: CdaR family protein [Candidatus Binatia bacterium]|jgi:YbbR domain-containing protein|nr:CdaR family protein [Candidatus Binatia bacterium]
MKLPALRFRRTPAPVDPGDASPRPPRRWPNWIRLPRRTAIRELVRRNPGLKLISILLACFLWYSINVLERDAERLVEVPISIRKVPPELIVTTPPTKPATLTVRGPGTILDGVDEHKSRLVVDMSSTGPGEVRIDLSNAVMTPELPRRLKVVRTQPQRLKLTVERLSKRRIPIKLDLAGSPALGYMIAQSTVTPDHVEVSGPASKVDDLKEISTEPIDLHGLARTFQRRVLLEWAGDFVVFVPDKVQVNVEVEEIMVSREFRRVAVTVINGDGVTVTPGVVNLTLHGPQRLLHNFKIPDGSVVVDAAGLAPGSYEMPVQLIDLPPAIEIAARQPDRIRVQVGKGQGG